MVFQHRFVSADLFSQFLRESLQGQQGTCPVLWGTPKQGNYLQKKGTLELSSRYVRWDGLRVYQTLSLPSSCHLQVGSLASIGNVSTLLGLQCWDARSICLLISSPTCAMAIVPWSWVQIGEQKLLRTVLQLWHPTVAVLLPQNKASLETDPGSCWSGTHQCEEEGCHILFYCSSRCAELFSVLSLSRGWCGTGVAQKRCPHRSLLTHWSGCGYEELVLLLFWLKLWCCAVIVVVFLVLGSKIRI